MTRSVLAAIGLTALLLGAAACGDTDDSSAGPTPDPASATPTQAPSGDWLLRFSTAEGADGEVARAVYVRFDPETGQAARTILPGVRAGDTYADAQALLVSADHERAILDATIPKAQRASGKVPVYSIGDGSATKIDLRAMTGDSSMVPVAWAFDPDEADLLRVVDRQHRVWAVDLAAGAAKQESTLKLEPGWFFAGGFDKNTGQPYIESVDSEETVPPGNGDDDTRPVERQGGSIVLYDGDDLGDLPTPPCDFAGGFAFDGGSTYLFCADDPSITAYVASSGSTEWTAVGTASPAIVPRAVADLAVVLPPVD